MTFLMVFNTGVFGYALNLLGVIISDLSRLEDQHFKEMIVINKYMNENFVSRETRLKI
jgi:hypothetical protein